VSETAKGIQRTQVPFVWVGEVAYRKSRWITLWTTCRMTRDQAQIALEEHTEKHDDGYHLMRIAKFVRGRRN
jgi:hypothetical protein